MRTAIAGSGDRRWAARRTLAWTGGLLLVLGACELGTPQAEVAAEPPTLPAVAPIPVAVDEKPSSRSPSTGATEPAVAALPAVSWTVVGMSREEVTELLGPPTFRRRDAPAEIWQYRASTCTLDLFLYRDKNGENYRVNYAEARGKSSAKVGLSDCISRFVVPVRKSRAG